MQNCPVCGHATYKKFLTCKDYLVSGEVFDVVECEACGMLFTTPKPEADVIGKYYQSTEYVSHSDTKKGIVNRIYHVARKKALKNKLGIVRKYSKGNMLADVGCGTGAFAAYCQSQGLRVQGFEPDKNSRAYAIEKNKISAQEVEMFFADNAPRYDIITLWHVLEHVEDLHKYFENFKKRLTEAGTLIIAVPNPQSYDAKFYREHWAAYDVPRHLYHFGRENIKKLADMHGFDVISVLPMKMDSYYISMLSEKHRYGKTRLVSAFFKGLKSNRIARRNGEYSSLIYILKIK